ncbi:MAG: hypothetical protein GKS01_09310 [Alphaproteobacteria bacterium]|nr:hypothetical protein [Alphaproteobacteria bacterium]
MTTQNTQRQILLTPGPLTTPDSVKEAILRDWGSRDRALFHDNRIEQAGAVHCSCSIYQVDIGTGTDRNDRGT